MFTKRVLTLLLKILIPYQTREMSKVEDDRSFQGKTSISSDNIFDKRITLERQYYDSLEKFLSNKDIDNSRIVLKDIRKSPFGYFIPNIYPPYYSSLAYLIQEKIAESIDNSDTEMFLLLIRYIDYTYAEKMLIKVCYQGNLLFVKVIVEGNVDMDTTRAFLAAMRRNDSTIALYLLERSQSN